MNAFARAAQALHADVNLSEAASYAPAAARGLPTVAVRVILSEPIEPLGVGVGANTRRLMASLPLAALHYDPRRGDSLWVGPAMHRVEAVDRDIEASAWRLTLAERP